ncbi:MAG: DMT family transporter [Actinomycetota bacterium]
MVVLVSLLTAVIYGAGDFCGGLAAKRCRVVEVVAISHVFGLAGATAVSLGIGAPVTGTDLLLGGLGGVLGGIGVALLYRRLAVGPMQVVAPLTAVTSAAVPAIWAVATGERPGPVVVAGLLLALVSIGLVSRSGDDDGDAPITPAVIAESLLAGAGFGGFFILLDMTDPASAPWPVVGARLFTAIGLGAVVLVGWRRNGAGPLRAPDRRSLWPLLAATGLLDTAANAGFLYATISGSLAVAAVLTSLYPVSTAVLAWVALGERMNRFQYGGFVGALVASGLIAAG